MQGYKVWTDPAANRLHLLIRRSLSQSEIQTARWSLVQASEILKPDFSINIQQDFQQSHTTAENSVDTSIIRISRDLKHILGALHESAA